MLTTKTNGSNVCFDLLFTINQSINQIFMSPEAQPAQMGL